MSYQKRNLDNWNDSQAESPSVDCPVCSASIDLATAEIITAPSVAAPSVAVCCPQCGALASLLPDDPRAYEPAGYDPNPEGDLPF